MVFSHCLLCRLLGHNRPEETLLMIFYLFAVIYCARRLQQQQQRWRPYLWWLYSLLIRELVTSLYINPLQCEHISVLRHSFNYLIPCRSSSMIGGIIIRLGMHIVDLSLSLSLWYSGIIDLRLIGLHINWGRARSLFICKTQLSVGSVSTLSEFRSQSDCPSLTILYLKANFGASLYHWALAQLGAADSSDPT